MKKVLRYINFTQLLGLIILLHFSFTANAQSLEYARQVIDTLGSKYMAGRGYVEDGDLKAASFIAEEFKKFELKKFHNSYFQNFNVDVNTFPDTVSVFVDEKKLVPGVDYIIDPCSPSIQGSFATVKFKSSWLKSDDILQKQLKKHSGKFLMIDDSELKLDNAQLRTLKNGNYGLSGIMVITTKKLIWSVSPNECQLPQIIVKESSVGSIKKIKVDIEQNFVEKYKTQNVVGYIPGKKFPDSLIVFTAHYDHIGKMGNDAIFPGANDNASGIAMLLSLAKHYSDEPPPFSVAFIAFAAEEMGLIGSKHFVENPFFPLKNIKFLINLDMVGTGDDGLTAVNGSVYKNYFNLLVSINESRNLLPVVKERGESCNSDHCFFYLNGVPSFFIYTMGGIQAYHDVYDTPKTLPLTKFSEVYQLIHLFSDEIMGSNVINLKQ